MEIKKIIGKVLAAIVIGFALMVLYTNAFPLKIKTGTEWVESGTCCYNNGVIKVNSQEAKELAEKYPKRYKYDEETDTFYYVKEHYIYWEGFEIYYN